MSRVFISDLHLESELDAKYKAFQRVLYNASKRFDDVYILGDLVEVWVGDDDDSAFAQALVHDLRECALTTSIFVMHGNRDFLYREGFADRANVALIDDPFLLAAGDIPEPVLLAHGDAFCTSDTEYMNARSLFRSREWQDQILNTTLDERRLLARSLREQSRTANQLKAANITDVVEAEIESALVDRNCKLMIHGHTHRPGIHKLGYGATRYVLGDWDACGWLLRQDGSTFSLERFAFTS